MKAALEAIAVMVVIVLMLIWDGLIVGRLKADFDDE